MSTVQEPPDEFVTINDEAVLNYWQDKMKNDIQFVRYVTEVYKKQQLELQNKEGINKKVTQHTHVYAAPLHSRQQTVMYHPPPLMDNIVLVPPTHEQQRNEHDWVRTTKSSTGYPNTSTYNQTSSTSSNR